MKNGVVRERAYWYAVLEKQGELTHWLPYEVKGRVVNQTSLTSHQEGVKRVEAPARDL
jgi:hypothetical protein